jgi:hypothetical protein
MMKKRKFGSGGKVKRYADGDLVMGGAASDTGGLGLGLGLPKDISAELRRPPSDKELMDANLAAVRAREAADMAKPKAKPKAKADAPKPKSRATPEAAAPAPAPALEPKAAAPKPEPKAAAPKPEPKAVAPKPKPKPKPELKPTPVKPTEDTLAGRRDARVANRARGISPGGAAIEARNARVAARAANARGVAARDAASRAATAAARKDFDTKAGKAGIGVMLERAPRSIKYAKGGSVTRGDGIAKKGHTKGKMR